MGEYVVREMFRRVGGGEWVGGGGERDGGGGRDGGVGDAAGMRWSRRARLSEHVDRCTLTLGDRDAPRHETVAPRQHPLRVS